MATCNGDQVFQLRKEEREKQNPTEIEAKVSNRDFILPVKTL
jgi:hypothetical protein